MECKVICSVCFYHVRSSIDLTRMECKVATTNKEISDRKSIDLTRMECKVIMHINTTFLHLKYRFNQNGM